MSYTFSAALAEPPTYEEVFAALPPDVRCGSVDPDELGGPMDEDQILHVYAWGVSTRSVELAWQRGSFSVRILACSCAEDYRMALECIAAVARAGGADIVSEEGTRFSPDEWEADYGDEWIVPHVRSMIDAMFMIEPEATGTMPGPTREFHLGPRTRRAVDAEAARTGDRVGALFSRMRELFYPSEDAYYAANAMRVTTKDGTAYTATAWMPQIGYLFPKVDYLLVPDGDDMLHVPFDALEELAGRERVRWIDEERPLVEPIEPFELDTFTARCRALAAPLGARPGTTSASVGSKEERPAAPGFSLGCIVLGLAAAAGLVLLLARSC